MPDFDLQDTINILPPNLIYKSAAESAKELVPGLREQGAEIVIAVTHMREPNVIFNPPMKCYHSHAL